MLSVEDKVGIEESRLCERSKDVFAVSNKAALLVDVAIRRDYSETYCECIRVAKIKVSRYCTKAGIEDGDKVKVVQNN